MLVFFPCISKKVNVEAVVAQITHLWHTFVEYNVVTCCVLLSKRYTENKPYVSVFPCISKKVYVEAVAAHITHSWHTFVEHNFATCFVFLSKRYTDNKPTLQTYDDSSVSTKNAKESFEMLKWLLLR